MSRQISHLLNPWVHTWHSVRSSVIWFARERSHEKKCDSGGALVILYVCTERKKMKYEEALQAFVAMMDINEDEMMNDDGNAEASVGWMDWLQHDEKRKM